MNIKLSDLVFDGNNWVLELDGSQKAVDLEKTAIKIDVKDHPLLEDIYGKHKDVSCSFEIKKED